MPNAVIDDSAIISPSAQIGSFTVILSDSQIGDHSKIGHHCRIGKNVQIGQSCKIGDFCEIQSDSVIEDNVEISSHTVIGGEGFGYATDQNYVHHHVPQIGNVEIGKYTRVGSACTFDRATYDQTRVGSHNKFESQCHLGHNVRIENDNFFQTRFFSAGSTHYGSNNIFEYFTAVIGHLRIGNDVSVGSRSMMTKNLSPGKYKGFPLVTLADYLESQSIIKKLSSISKVLMSFTPKESK